MSDNQDFDRNEPQDSGQVPEQPQFGRRIEAVSYTHLTLPTSDLV